MKNPDSHDSDPPGGAGETQQVNIEDVDLDALPDAPIRQQLRTAPPPLPPVSSLAPSSPSAPPHYHVPPPSAPEPPRRGPLFFIGVLAAVLLVSALAGTALTVFRRPAPVPAPSPTAGSAKAPGPAVITIPVVDMDDVPDSGP